MTIIHCLYQSIKLDDLDEKLIAIGNILKQRANEAGVGLLADLSAEGILLIIAAIKFGIKCALIPLREPSQIIDSWLKDLNIKQVVASFRPPLGYELSVELLVLADLLAVQKNLGALDACGEFLSILRSSGTTATPKSVLIEGRAHRASAASVNDYFSVTANSCWLLSLPMSHVSGLSIIFRMLLSGGGLFVAPNHEELILALRSGKITHCSLVPSQLKRLLSEDVDLSSLHAVIIGGDALMPKEREQALALSWPIFESYGLTETASMVMVKDTILPHAEIALDSDGEILVKGQSLFSGYLNNAQRNLTLDSEGYFATGDLGARDFAGRLYVSGRKNNRIISGGENIQAEEVEAILEGHEAVLSALVIAEADALLGHRPVAYLKWREQPVAISELKSYLKERLAGYKCPIAFLDWPKEIEVSFKKPRRQLYRYHQSH